MTGIHLDSSVLTVLGGRGTKKDKDRAAGLEKLGLRTVRELLDHHPRNYLDTGKLTEVRSLEEGQMLTVVGEVVSSKHHTYNDRRTGRPAHRVEVELATDGPPLKMTFFAQKSWIAENWERRLHEGAKGIFTGKVGRFGRYWQLANPKMTLFAGDGDDSEESARELVENLKDLWPLYRASGALESSDLQRMVSFSLDVVDEIPESLTPDLRREYGVCDVHTAYRWIHTPDDYGQVGAARKRFRFEEALVTQLVLARRRAAIRAQGAQARTGGGGLLAAFDARLPFELTAGQREVGVLLEQELAEPHPMNRLLQGEVGSGKTVVALRAMLRVVDSGGQTALLAPTEVLAQQHHRSITAMLGDLAAGGMLGGAEDATTVTLLTGSMGKAQRREALLHIASGEAGIVIGTHALLQEHVSFADLGLVVVDEQHRFGVEQRAALTDKAGTPPHLLVMTATPIPRTVAMTVFGDLEVSTLRELPAGRAPIQTNVVPLQDRPQWMTRVWERVREEVAKGHQVYVVCPRISGDEQEEGESDQVDVDDEGTVLPGVRAGSLAAVEEVVPELAAGALTGLRVEMLHGRMFPDDKDRVMRSFAAGEIDVLVSTTVIEVGVDVTNATTMVLLDADRFGISQLHQLRGRVGRSGLPGLCLLVSYAEPESPAVERLTAVAATTDGFELSRVDLERRHEGDVLGSSQSGFRSSLSALRVLRDEETIVTARGAAAGLLDADPDLAAYPVLRGRVDELEQSRASDFMERS
jgi:ATP-dependent DNA helicase RecG